QGLRSIAPLGALLALPAHEPNAVRALCLVLIVRTAAQPHVVDRGLAAPGDRDLVIELEPLPRLAAPSRMAHERAAALVAPHDGALHVRGDVTASRRGRRAAAAGPVRDREPRPLEPRDERVERPVQ